MQSEQSKRLPTILDTKGRGLDAVKGQTLSGRYLVGQNINNGSFGSIFDCQDQVTGEKLVIKFSEDY